MNRNNLTAERLKLCREKKGLTQIQVAEKMLTQRQIISYHESGSRLPSINDVVFYAALYGVSSDYLLGLSDTASTDIEIKSICEKTGLSDGVVEFLSGLNDDMLRSFDNPQMFANFINAAFSDMNFSGYMPEALEAIKQKVAQAQASISDDIYNSNRSTTEFVTLSKREQLEYCFYRLEREFSDFAKRYSGFNEYQKEYNSEQQRADERCFIMECEENGNDF